MYYYFKLKNGVENQIKETIIPINTNIMQMYRELTPEQIEFYTVHPDATVSEVVNCQLINPEQEDDPDIEFYAHMKMMDFKDACLSTISISQLEYNMANAVLAGTVLTYSGDRYYSTNTAKSIMKQYMDETYAAMTLYDKHAPIISKCKTINEIDVAFSNAMAELDAKK